MALLSRKSVDYYEYIQSPKWKRKAKGAKRRAGHRCQVCYRHRNEVTLNAHHRTYDRLGRERASDLTVLCVICHELYEGNKRLVKIAAQTQPKIVGSDSGAAADEKAPPASEGEVEHAADTPSFVHISRLERIFGGRWNRARRFAEEIGYIWYLIAAMLVFSSAMLGLGTLRSSSAEEIAEVLTVQTALPTVTVPAAVVKVENNEEPTDCRAVADLAVYDEPLAGKLFDVIPSGTGVNIEQRAQCDGEMWLSLADGRWATGKDVECTTLQAPEVDCPVLARPEDEPSRVQCVVNLQANVRKGPGLSFEIVDQLMPGTSVGVSTYNDECSGERWYQMAEERWMASFLLNCSEFEDLPSIAVACLAPPVQQ